MLTGVVSGLHPLDVVLSAEVHDTVFGPLEPAWSACLLHVEYAGDRRIGELLRQLAHELDELRRSLAPARRRPFLDVKSGVRTAFPVDGDLELLALDVLADEDLPDRSAKDADSISRLARMVSEEIKSSSIFVIFPILKRQRLKSRVNALDSFS